MKSILKALLLVMAATPAMAGETPWQEVMPDVAIRLVSVDLATEAGTTWIALEIDMPASTKTYWRVPGESGIPPKFDFSGSTDIGGATVAWPYPTRAETDTYLDHAYYGHTILPIEVELTGNRPVVQLSAKLGICSDICVPVSVDFALGINPAAPDAANMLRVRQARAEVPAAWEGPDPIGEVVYLSAENVLVAVLADEDFPDETAIADIAGKHLLFGPPKRDRTAGTLRFPLLGKGDAGLAEGATVHITFLAPSGPYEVVRTLQTTSCVGNGCDPLT
ncbi:protein-disulfide reductase DsbD domain-containing protein [Pelagibacterium limicola]|uniref:protein-disulfide reductase DsbD domain-containing protein n=1 Tax=Pelagibacterium limicola TaxID=2791022 RepID=UPI0018B005D4|nr:protein-disulfide reductase DsbD domain-containing protein [Pelagibacterium limicola]